MIGQTDVTINAVLRCWGLAGVVETTPQLNQGFSRSAVWRVRVGNERYALRRLTNELADAKHTCNTHRLMRYAGRVLNYVPWPRSTNDGPTVALCEGSFWSLESWLPGAPLSEVQIPAVELATTALWMFHEVTHDSHCFGEFAQQSPCGAVEQRHQLLRAWRDERHSSHMPSGCREDLVARMQQIESQLPRAVGVALPVVEAARGEVVPQQPILGDLRRGDLLFDAGRVTGLVDFGAAKIDSPLVDLTRLLGELAGEQQQLWQAGLAAYQLHRQLTDTERRLIAALDAGGVVAASINWLRWLSEGTVKPSEAVLRRLGELLNRLEPLACGNLIAVRSIAP